MRKALFTLWLISLALFYSCKKSNVAKPITADVDKTQIKDPDSKLRTNLYNSGSTAALTLQPNGSYTATWGGANLVFTNLSVPTEHYKFGDRLAGYTVQCTNGTIISTGSSYFVGSINVMSQADMNFILIRTNGYLGNLFDYEHFEREIDTTKFKQSKLPNFYNEVIVPYTGNSSPFSGGLIYDPGTTSHVSIAPSSFVATVPNISGILLKLGDLTIGSTKLVFYRNSVTSHNLIKINAFDSLGNPLDVYSGSGMWQVEPGVGGFRVTGSVIVGNSNTTPITFDDVVYGD